MASVVRLVGAKDDVMSLLLIRGAMVYLREEILRSTVDRCSRIIYPIVIVEASINPEGRDEHKGIVQSDRTANSPLRIPVGAKADMTGTYEHVSVSSL